MSAIDLQIDPGRDSQRVLALIMPGARPARRGTAHRPQADSKKGTPMKTRPRLNSPRNCFSGRACRPTRRTHLRLELLEDRSVPTVLTVNSTADGPVDLTDANVTLRDAIYAANNDLPGAPGGPTGSGADQIFFDPTVFATPRTITLINGQLDITGNLTIDGPGADLLAVNGNNAS